RDTGDCDGGGAERTVTDYALTAPPANRRGMAGPNPANRTERRRRDRLTPSLGPGRRHCSTADRPAGPAPAASAPTTTTRTRSSPPPCRAGADARFDKVRPPDARSPDARSPGGD